MPKLQIGTTLKLGRRLGMELQGGLALYRAGMIGGAGPEAVLKTARALRDFGSYSGAVEIAALRHGQLPAIADDFGVITYAELADQTDRLANLFLARGYGSETKLGIMCRNSRWPLLASFAATRAGMTVVFLNTGFSARQTQEVAAREDIQLLVHDEGLTEAVAGVEPADGRLVCSTRDPGDDQLAALIATGRPGRPPVPAKPGRVVLLTSGTTGTPKGAPRSDPKGLVLPGSVLQRMPFKAQEATVVAPPLFHGTGLLIALLTIGLGSKLILRQRFDPAQTVADVEEHRATGLCVVPIMLQRILALDDAGGLGARLNSLRVIFSAGARLPVEVAQRATDLLGDVIYNLYGSTEVALATMATPDDLRAAPLSVGRPLLGARVRILDDDARPVPAGQVGRIFVGSLTPFEGYTGGGNKEIIDGLLSTGDLGHFDGEGRLYVDGRDDEMIISGGENVFPKEVEELLVTHPRIVDAAAIGVDDAEFGQRLRAFVVAADGAAVSETEVKDFVKQNLARYKVPREVVVIDEIPRNPTGKVLKRVLAER
jgi:fatty-acyl-CoA synthase